MSVSMKVVLMSCLCLLFAVAGCEDASTNLPNPADPTESWVRWPIEENQPVSVPDVCWGSGGDLTGTVSLFPRSSVGLVVDGFAAHLYIEELKNGNVTDVLGNAYSLTGTESVLQVLLTSTTSEVTWEENYIVRGPGGKRMEYSTKRFLDASNVKTIFPPQFSCKG